MKITMAHGSGGKDSAELMTKIFGKHFSNDILDKMEAAAVLQVNGKIAYSTDSLVVTPILLNGEDIGGMFINTSGIWRIQDEMNVSASNCNVGDVVILSGNLGDHHACILSARMNMNNGIKSDSACLADITNGLFENGIRVNTMRDVTRGGLGTVLNEIAEKSFCSIEINEISLPMDEEVKAFADILGLDPMYMANEGKMIAIVNGEDAEKALKSMRETLNGRNAAIIGYVKEGHGVKMITRLGGSRVVDVLYGEGLPRIC